MENKRNQLESRRKKWMSDREMNLMKDEIVQEVVVKSKSPIAKHVKSSSLDTDLFLNKLTDKLTVHIRQEIQKEMNETLHNSDIRDTVAQKMESFLEAELTTYVCKICYELMVSPNNTPILLFPCGHTFCKQCIESHFKKSKEGLKSNPGCPYCRVSIQSHAFNQSLKDLIDQYARQKNKVSSNSIHLLDEIFPPSTILKHKQDDMHHHSSSSQPSSSSTSSDRTRYVNQLKSCEMRYVILHHELDEIKSEKNNLHQKRSKIQQAVDHLQQEKKRIEESIGLLIEEKELVEQHITSQVMKDGEVKNSLKISNEKEHLMIDSLSKLQADMDKLKLLVQGIQHMN